MSAGMDYCGLLLGFIVPLMIKPTWIILAKQAVLVVLQLCLLGMTSYWRRYRSQTEQSICSRVHKGNNNVKKTPGGLLWFLPWNKSSVHFYCCIRRNRLFRILERQACLHSMP